MKGGKKTIQRLEQRVRELEIDLENEQRRYSETEKNLRKQDRRLKDMAVQGEEDKKAHERFVSEVDSLQQKIKAYKRQIEEAVSYYYYYYKLFILLREKKALNIYYNFLHLAQLKKTIRN